MQTRSDTKQLFLVVEQLRKTDWNVMLFHTVHLSLGVLHSSDLMRKVFLIWFLSSLCQLPTQKENTEQLTQKVYHSSWTTSQTVASMWFLFVCGAIPGHLYSFLACAISPLLRRVRWPMAGRIPLSSREGRMVSRNMPLKKIKIKIDPKNHYQVSVTKLSEFHECKPVL